MSFLYHQTAIWNDKLILQLTTHLDIPLSLYIHAVSLNGVYHQIFPLLFSFLTSLSVRVTK